jgi:NarL family two-component system response regulator LiaR
LGDRPIRVIIVDDHPVVRGGLRLLLGSDPAFEVVGEGADGTEAIRLTGSLEHDVVLMDLVMPGIDGVEATRRILARLPETRVLVLTSFGGDEKLFPALDAGALGFVLKDSTAEELVHAIRQVSRGLASLSPSVTRRLVRKVQHEPGPDAPREPLTAREQEILRELTRGASNDEIADALYISPATVRTHLTHILAKLGLARRTQAMLYALKNGIATLE